MTTVGSKKRASSSVSGGEPSRSTKKGKAAAAAAGESDPSAGAGGELPLGKALASTEKRVRDGAVRSLAAFLASKGDEGLGEEEMARLWAGLFYCVWMSDKPRVQQALCDQLAELVLVFPTRRNGLAFFKAFWHTMAREWSKLDKHRINKYLLLMRRFLNAGIRLVALERWDADVLAEFNAILSDPRGPLAPNDAQVPTSITYHVTEIFLEELEKAVTSVQDQSDSDNEDEADDEDDVALIPVNSVLAPFVKLASETQTKKTYTAVMENVFAPFLDDTLRAAAREAADDNDEEEDEEDDEGEVQYAMTLALAEPVTVSPTDEDEEQEGEGEGPLAIRASVFQQLFSAASSPTADQARRAALYAFYRTEQERE